MNIKDAWPAYAWFGAMLIAGILLVTVWGNDAGTCVEIGLLK